MFAVVPVQSGKASALREGGLRAAFDFAASTRGPHAESGVERG
jgi:hypothetical protein